MLVDYIGFLKSKMVIAKKTGIAIDEEEISDVLKTHQRDAVMWAAAGHLRGVRTWQDHYAARMVPSHPLCAIKRGRRGMATELNADYFRDGVG